MPGFAASAPNVETVATPDPFTEPEPFTEFDGLDEFDRFDGFDGELEAHCPDDAPDPTALLLWVGNPFPDIGLTCPGATVPPGVAGLGANPFAAGLLK